MRFEWDENKNEQNLSKHGIDFSDAHLVFENPILARVDERFDYGEKRWIALGKLETVIVVVVFTKRRDNIRIISIRKANKQERSVYNEKVNKN